MSGFQWPAWAKWPLRNVAYGGFVVKNSGSILRGQLWRDANNRGFVIDEHGNWYEESAFVGK